MSISPKQPSPKLSNCLILHHLIISLGAIIISLETSKEMLLY